ncbi:hypothetical protein D3C85_1571520 [compost metagenome]
MTLVAEVMAAAEAQEVLLAVEVVAVCRQLRQMDRKLKVPSRIPHRALNMCLPQMK